MPKSFFRATLLTLPMMMSSQTFADADYPVYAIVTTTLGAAFLGNHFGNSIASVTQSGIDQHQVSLMVGRDTNMDITRLAYRLSFRLPQWQTNDFILKTSLETSVAHWQAESKYTNNSLNDIGITPMFTLQRSANDPWYIEVGVGAHLLSDTKINGYDKSSQFQFGDQFGIGWQNHQLRAGYRYLHVSNGNITTPNPSTDFHSLELGYRF
jgi:hypothetical protein